ncbi:MAG: permease [Chloroflexi bacterium]|nr:permease [Chloroflexota bacterium]
MELESRLGWVQGARRGQASLQYKGHLAGLVVSLALALLGLVDVRRGFLFPDYALQTPWFAFSPWHLLMLGAGVAGCLVSYRRMKEEEARLGPLPLASYVKGLALVVFALLVADLFAYRGVAAARAASAGEVGAGWLEAFGATGWLRPAALAASYLLTVWHATFLGVLLAGLALTVLPHYLRPFLSRTGWGGSLFGAVFALPQPFCSCCASVVAPSLVRRGASRQFTLAFVVGSPMLNVTSLILAALLLPPPYAAVRVAAGLILAVPVTWGVARLADGWRGPRGSASPRRWSQWASRWSGRYCRLFHLEEMVQGRNLSAPSALLASWLTVSLRIALLIVPTLFLLSLVTAGLVQVLPESLANNGLGVVLAAVAGTLLMVPTWAEVPVALQMLQAGFSGPAATLLIVLPPVSLPCLALLGGALGQARVVALLGVVVAGLGAAVGMAFL